MLITNYILIIIIILFAIQILAFLKLIQVIKQINKFLFEFRILIKQGSLSSKNFSSIFYKNTCQFCKHRMSFIQISDDVITDNFYYKCRKRNIEISLADTCNKFERDYSVQ
jgi:hypothetical protein